MLGEITPLILSLNEAPNVGRSLERLAWAREVVIVDSGSTDATREIVARYPNARLVEHAFSTHAQQWEFGLTQTGIASEWILAMDADFMLTDNLAEEIRSLRPSAEVAGYSMSFIYCIEGEPVRSGIYPPVIVLYRRSTARYVQDGHTQRVIVNGGIERLRSHMLHDDRKPLSAWISAQVRYMKLEAGKLNASRFGELRWTGRLRKLIVVAPLVMPFYCLVVRGGLLDGRRGVLYAMQRTVAEAILSLYLLQRSETGTP